MEGREGERISGLVLNCQLEEEETLILLKSENVRGGGAPGPLSS